MGYVYFITADEDRVVKIGYSDYHPKRRLRQLQCTSPIKLSLVSFRPGTRDDEGHLHELFADCRLWGEFFRMTQPLFDEMFALGVRATFVRERRCYGDYPDFLKDDFTYCYGKKSYRHHPDTIAARREAAEPFRFIVMRGV